MNLNDTPELPSFIQYDQSGFWTYQAKLTDPRIPNFIDALMQNKYIKFQSKVFRVLRILLTHPTIVVMQEIR
jgi:hypothetical protein